MAMMARMNKEMSGMNFRVSKEAAVFATEAHIHQMCAVANLAKTCCFEGAAYTLITDLSPERFTEWKAALINQATGKMPHLFSMLERPVCGTGSSSHAKEHHSMDISPQVTTS
jgi:hypothetical protein